MRKEVLEELKDMPNDKAPGVYGFNVEFFREFLDLMGEDVIQAIS